MEGKGRESVLGMGEIRIEVMMWRVGESNEGSDKMRGSQGSEGNEQES